jgi:hypothetical protein
MCGYAALIERCDEEPTKGEVEWTHTIHTQLESATA